MKNFIFYSVIASVALAGCAGTTDEHYYKVSTNPYTVSGRTYYPLDENSAVGFSETGVASWYGPMFQDKQTASGDMYDKYAFTAAHKTLPFGTRVRVTNLENKLTSDVIINDRGPFKSGRIIDVSYAAAKQLNITDSGIANVRIDVIGNNNPVQNTNTIQQNSNRYYVQVGAYSIQENANDVAQDVSDMGYATTVRASNGKYLVLVGPYGVQSRATGVSDNLSKTYSGAKVVQQKR